MELFSIRIQRTFQLVSTCKISKEKKKGNAYQSKSGLLSYSGLLQV